MRPDALAGACPQCGGATLWRQVDNFPTPLAAEGGQVDYQLHFCPYCGWHQGKLKVQTHRAVSQAELSSIQRALHRRIGVELAQYLAFQQKLAALPLNLAYTAIGAALGFEGAELSLAQQLRRGVSPEVAYGEIRAALANDPLAPVFFQAFTEIAAGQQVLRESLAAWRDMGYPAPWRDLVPGWLETG
jgi:hypothetical protein